jgi:hypothetical protein
MGGDRRLPQANATVATGDFRVSENLKTLLLQALLQMFEEETVLERSPA